MQMQAPQSMMDQVEFAGMVDGKILSARTPKAEEKLAKEILWALHMAHRRVGWEIDIKDSMLTIWSDMHPQYAYRCHLHQIGKGGRNLPKIATELLRRIVEGAAQECSIKQRH